MAAIVYRLSQRIDEWCIHYRQMSLLQYQWWTMHGSLRLVIPQGLPGAIRCNLFITQIKVQRCNKYPLETKVEPVKTVISKRSSVSTYILISGPRLRIHTNSWQDIMTVSLLLQVKVIGTDIWMGIWKVWPWIPSISLEWFSVRDGWWWLSRRSIVNDPKKRSWCMQTDGWWSSCRPTAPWFWCVQAAWRAMMSHDDGSNWGRCSWCEHAWPKHWRRWLSWDVQREMRHGMWTYECC